MGTRVSENCQEAVTIDADADEHLFGIEWFFVKRLNQWPNGHHFSTWAYQLILRPSLCVTASSRWFPAKFPALPECFSSAKEFGCNLTRASSIYNRSTSVPDARIDLCEEQNDNSHRSTGSFRSFVGSLS